MVIFWTTMKPQALFNVWYDPKEFESEITKFTIRGAHLQICFLHFSTTRGSSFVHRYSKSEHSILVWTQFHPDVSMNNKLLLGSDLDHFYVIFWRGKGGRVKWDRTTVLSSSFNSSKEPFQVEIPWEHLYGSEGNRTAWTVIFVESAESFYLTIIFDLYS